MEDHMARMWKTRARWALLVALTGALPGCLAAAAAAAGAGTGIYLTTRNRCGSIDFAK